MNNSDILAEFGRLLIHSVRDKTYNQFEQIVAGELKSKSAVTLKKEVGRLEKNDLEILRSVVRDTIDSTLHHFLWMIEQSEEYDIVKNENGKSKVISLRDISDGLCGELYSQEGWIEKFSKYPPSIT